MDILDMIPYCTAEQSISQGHLQSTNVTCEQLFSIIQTTVECLSGYSINKNDYLNLQNNIQIFNKIIEGKYKPTRFNKIYSKHWKICYGLQNMFCKSLENYIVVSCDMSVCFAVNKQLNILAHTDCHAFTVYIYTFEIMERNNMGGYLPRTGITKSYQRRSCHIVQPHEHCEKTTFFKRHCRQNYCIMQPMKQFNLSLVVRKKTLL